MSNKVQINCNPDNKMRIRLLKQEWIKLRMNQECVEKEERLIKKNKKIMRLKYLFKIPIIPIMNFIMKENGG